MIFAGVRIHQQSIQSCFVMVWAVMFPFIRNAIMLILFPKALGIAQGTGEFLTVDVKIRFQSMQQM